MTPYRFTAASLQIRLAADSLRALQAPLPELAPTWTSGLRTGDTASGERAAQDRRLPTLLVTTPESVSLLLASADARERLASVRLVVVDEWHELVGNKRGVQVQLALARLSGWNPALQVWGMSATLGNLEEALHTLLPQPVPDTPQPPPAVLVQGRIDKRLEVQVMLPARADRFAWAGHMGLSLLPQVVQSKRQRPPWCSPTPGRKQSAGTRRCWRRGPTGRAPLRCTMGRWGMRCATGSSKA